MKKNNQKLLSKFLSFALILAMVLFNTVAVFAAEEGSEEQTVSVPEAVETAEPAASEPAVTEPAGEDNANPEDVQDKDRSEESEVTETDNVSENDNNPSESGDGSPGSDSGSAESEETVAPAEDDGSSPTWTLTTKETSYSSGDEEGSHWKDGHGWKNDSGNRLTMVDYDGSDAEISADSGIVTLTVAGVNRIGALKGDCSYQITGSGIVLIDKIDIGEGQSLSLHPNTTLYDEGSAAVFLKQKDDSYLLINGGITGILDEEYNLDGVKLVVPEGSSLTLSAMGVRRETWVPENSDEPKTDVTLYSSSIPYDAEQPVHDYGAVEVEKFAAKLVIGNKSSLTIDNGASVLLKTIAQKGIYGDDITPANLVIQGMLDVKGVLEGGLVEVSGGGTLKGTGVVKSADVELKPDGNLDKDMLLEDSALTIRGDYSRRGVSAKIKNSIIYLKGGSIYIPELYVSGNSSVSVPANDDLYAGFFEIGNITLVSGSNLDILGGDYPTIYPLNFVADSYLLISGAITTVSEEIAAVGEEVTTDSDETIADSDGTTTVSEEIKQGTVSVLAGFVEYTGKNTDNMPVVPSAIAARVLYTNVGGEIINDTIEDMPYFPLVMTSSQASAMAKTNQIPVMELSVTDAMVSEEVPARIWFVRRTDNLAPIDRNNNQYYTCKSFLEAYGIDSPDVPDSFAQYYYAVEIIYDGFARQRYFYDDRAPFSTENAIMIRILECTSQGQQGGSSITSVSTSVTGSGVIGGHGAGSSKSGTGAVVYKVSKTSQESPKPDNNNNNNSNNTNNNSSNSSSNNTNTNTNNKPNNNTNNNSNNNTNSNTNNKPDNNTNNNSSNNTNNNTNNKPNNNTNNNSSNNTNSSTNNKPNNNTNNNQSNNTNNNTNNKPNNNTNNNSSTNTNTNTNTNNKPDNNTNNNSSNNTNNSSANNENSNNSSVNNNTNNSENNNANTNGDNSNKGNTNAGTGKTKLEKQYSKKVSSSEVSDEGLVVTVSLYEPKTESSPEANQEMPQIWQLTVTKAGAAVTDLSGNAMKVAVPFSVPEDWGDPADVAEDSLYAVFADEEGTLTAYSAQYDPEADEVSFETEQTGDFVIVKFAYEEKPFTDDFYKKLAELKEIKDFLAVLEAEDE